MQLHVLNVIRFSVLY